MNTLRQDYGLYKSKQVKTIFQCFFRINSQLNILKPMVKNIFLNSNIYAWQVLMALLGKSVKMDWEID